MIPHIKVSTTLSMERNDCTVFALSSCLSIPYELAHEVLSEERKNGFGLRTDYLSIFLMNNGFRLLTDTFNCSLQIAVKRCNKGRFYLRTKNHAFAIVDGVVYDCNEPNERMKVERIYEKC